MIGYYREFFEKVPFPREGEAFLLEGGERLLRKTGSTLDTILDAFYESDFDIEALEARAAALKEDLGLHEYTVILILLICATRRLREEYRRRGYGESVFWDTMTDLRSKAQECRDVKGIWGTFVGFWFPNIFRCRTFRLGRLEFELDTWRLETDATLRGRRITPQYPVLNVHIPSGEPLDMEGCMDSLRRACGFFPRGEGEALLMRCGSWLLYEELVNTFPENSNIRQFCRLWKIYDTRPDPAGNDLWRIFGAMAGEDPWTLPTRTTVQRAVRDWLLRGNSMALGRGVLLFDGENLIKT